jgi:hypothetical protein
MVLGSPHYWTITCVMTIESSFIPFLQKSLFGLLRTKQQWGMN